MIKDKIEFTATGYLLGVLWDNSEGTYPSTHISGTSVEDILTVANTKLVDGSLEGTSRNFQDLLGAMLYIKTEITKFIDGKRFTNVSIRIHFIGDLTDEQNDFLSRSAYD